MKNFYFALKSRQIILALDLMVSLMIFFFFGGGGGGRFRILHVKSNKRKL